MNIQERYKKSVEAGYSDEEIVDYLSNSSEYSDKFKTSREAGYSDEDILSFFKGSEQPQQPKKEQRSYLEQGASFDLYN